MHHPSLRTLTSAVVPVVAALAWSLQLPAAHAQQSSAPAQSSAPTQFARPGQSPTPRDMPTPEQLEPGVNTTPSAADAPTGGTAPSRSAVEAPAANTSAANTPAANTAARKEAAAGSAGRKGPDRLQLDATEITGNRELPKVLYIVPWKRSDLGDLMGRPVNSLLDEVLQPLDRDVFQRENRYYNGLKPPAAPSKGGATQGAESKP